MVFKSRKDRPNEACDHACCFIVIQTRVWWC